MVKTGKSQSDAAKEIESFVEGCALVAHNSLFDFGFLLTLANEKNIEFKNNPVYCTCKLSRKINKQFNSHKLSSLAESFEIRLLNHHRALDDTIACLEVFLKTIKSSTNPKTSLKDGYLFNGKDFEGGDLSDLKIPNNLKSLPELVRKKSTFEIMYSGGTKKNQFRKVQGGKFASRPNGNVLYALCEETKLYKYYKLKRSRKSNRDFLSTSAIAYTCCAPCSTLVDYLRPTKYWKNANVRSHSSLLEYQLSEPH